MVPSVRTRGLTMLLQRRVTMGRGGVEASTEGSEAGEDVEAGEEGAGDDVPFVSDGLVAGPTTPCEGGSGGSVTRTEAGVASAGWGTLLEIGEPPSDEIAG